MAPSHLSSGFHPKPQAGWDFAIIAWRHLHLVNTFVSRSLILFSLLIVGQTGAVAQFTVNPTSATLCAGDTVTFQTKATDGTKPSATWTVNSATLNGLDTQSGDKVSFKAPGVDTSPTAPSGSVIVTATSSNHSVDLPITLVGACTDTRGIFNASFYIGLSIDTFAGDETIKYLNPNDAGNLHERAVGGFDFAYRLFGDQHHPVPNKSTARVNNLWVYGETVHGVRSADVDCTKQGSDFPTCQKDLTPPVNPGQSLFFILRNASSLEGYAGLRWEFLGLQQQSDSPANLYLKVQAGFLDVSGQNGSALDMHQIALGATATKGRYEDSYLEIGWGRSDVFHKNHDRKKVDAYLERKIDWLPDLLKGSTSFFAQITVDTDLGRGSDGIQSYIGFSFDLTKILGSQKK